MELQDKISLGRKWVEEELAEAAKVMGVGIKMPSLGTGRFRHKVIKKSGLRICQRESLRSVPTMRMKVSGVVSEDILVFALRAK